MSRRSQFGVLLAAAVLVAAGPALAPVAATDAPAAPSDESVVDAGTAAALVPLGITDTIQRIDRILESILDLVRTIQQLFGEGEGTGEGTEGGAGGEGG